MNPADSEHRGVTRRSQIIILIALLLAPVFLYGARGAVKTTSNDPRQWLPKNFAATDTYDWFQEQFGTDEIAVISWPNCTIKDPKTRQLGPLAVESGYFDRSRTGVDVMRQLITKSDVSVNGAINRLERVLIGPDRRTTCVVLTTSAKGMADRSAAVAELTRIAEQEFQLDPAELKLAGPTVDAAMIDSESRRLLFQLAGLSALLTLLVAALRLRSLRLALSVLFAAGYCTIVGLSVLYFSGGRMNLLMTMLPPLIYILSISSAVHLVNYFRDAQAEPRSPLPASMRAVKMGLFPCVIAALTTAIGLASLVQSKIDPIQEFGFYSALGVACGVVVLFLLLPALMQVFPPKPIVSQSSVSKDQSDSSQWLSRRIVDAIIRHHWLCSVACLGLMFTCAAQLPSITSTVKLQDRFLPSSDAIADYRWLEKNIGPMVPLEIVLKIDNQVIPDRVDQIGVVTAVQAKIESLDDSLAIFSAANLAPELPKSHSIADIAKRTFINGHRIAAQFREAKMMVDDGDHTLWRVSVRAEAIGDLDYGVFSNQIQKALDPLLADVGAEGIYTGVIPLIYKAQRELLNDLYRSFLVAFAVIALVLLFVLRSVTATAMTMIPNLFPAILVFGGIAWMGIPAQIGSVMTASAALGIAVDDTVHVLTWFRRGIARGLTRYDAIREAFAHCAGAMVHTSLICACGLMVFALSTFVPILHFAWLMFFLLMAALLGDLVLLPAILAGPLGVFFVQRKKKSPEVADGNEPEPV